MIQKQGPPHHSSINYGTSIFQSIHQRKVSSVHHPRNNPKDRLVNTGKLVQAILRACWAEEKDIAEDAVIRDCLTQAGFDPGLADRGLLAGAETYAANLEEAANRGVFGSPFYITDSDERFWGQDRLEDLDLYLAGKL